MKAVERTASAVPSTGANGKAASAAERKGIQWSLEITESSEKGNSIGGDRMVSTTATASSSNSSTDAASATPKLTGLNLADIHWANEVILVRGKGTQAALCSTRRRRRRGASAATCPTAKQEVMPRRKIKPRAPAQCAGSRRDARLCYSQRRPHREELWPWPTFLPPTPTPTPYATPSAPTCWKKAPISTLFRSYSATNASPPPSAGVTQLTTAQITQVYDRTHPRAKIDNERTQRHCCFKVAGQESRAPKQTPPAIASGMSHPYRCTNLQKI